jgi:hypothetical protein
MRENTIRTSTVCQFLSRIKEVNHSLNTSAANSQVGRASLRLKELVVRSAIFRWLTKEPEMDVVTIDLRHTWTVGPFLRVLDELSDIAAGWWEGATIRNVGRSTTMALREAPVAYGSLLVLSVILGAIAAGWAAGSQPRLGILCLVAAPAILGLRVTASWQELAESRAGQLLRAIIEPPDFDQEDR